MKQWLRESSRDAQLDAFYKIDRGSETVERTVDVVPLVRGGPLASTRGVLTVFKGFKPRHDLRPILAKNPFKHARKVREGSKSALDPVAAKFDSQATYTCHLSAEGRKLLSPDAPRKRLRVVVFWGTGSQCTRHGVAGAVEDAARPTLLINVSGVETTTKIKFLPPDDPLRPVELVANNVWPIGCTNDLVEQAILKFFPRLVDYDIDTLAAFSTGYLGLQESINRRVINLDAVERVVFYDCLYGSLRAPLARLQALRSQVKIVAYVATGKGNSFDDDAHPSMRNLTLKSMPGWSYIDLIYSAEYSAIASAHVLNEGRAGPYPIIDNLTTAHLDALDTLTAVLPARLLVMSDEAVFGKVRGSPPAGAISLAKFVQDSVNADAVKKFHKQIATTEQCLSYAQLMGWGMPPGEDWHDLIPAEFAWEYLS